MGNKMLIDATHPEETRVVVVRGNRVEEFDYESAAKKQLRGNIYLAKVTRVEPSLQAAFVNYGGNRHGFLAFNEIHPDYYHLPLAERQALKQEEQRASRAAQARGRREDHPQSQRGRDGGESAAGQAGPNAEEDEAAELEVFEGESAAEDAAMDMRSTERFGSETEITSDTAIALEAALPETKYSGDLYGASADTGEDEDADDAAAYDPADAGERAGEDARPSDARQADTGDDDEDEDEDDEEDEDDDAENGVEVINDDGSAGPVHARKHGNGDAGAAVSTVEFVGSEDALEELPERVRRRRRVYKIQEVIKRGQIILVQVVKEERGNKGAALTTYLSLAGRYTVLMPNTGSGGGISRKISSPADRKRLREIAGELDVPDGMGLIIRTAGASRTKTEVKRDHEYLLRLWENVRELTLRSTAPSLVYEEGDLIKRSIRDLYNREIDEVLVAGDEAYRDAKDFMRMLMPSHAKNVQLYKDPEPVFIRYEVERQLNAMFIPQVTLPSGGYIVLNQTEALVAIDVNSGKATREFSIEDTALKTNMEASEEIARQLRLRDLAGLIVVDFIDMEEKRNNRAVERKLKECLRNDRARIQVGRISHFGLLEMSRQRLRTGMIEGSTCQCPACQGTGLIRSTESVALSVLRGLEDWLRTNALANLNAATSTEVALYILNHKRGYLRDIEQRYGVSLSITANERLHGGNFLIEKLSPVIPSAPSAASQAIRQTDWGDEASQETAAEAAPEAGEDEDVEQSSEDNGERKSRRRRRRRGRREAGSENGELMNGAAVEWDDDDVQPTGDVAEDEEAVQQVSAAGPESEDENGNGNRRRSRRRGRRGGRHQRTRQMREDGVTQDENGVRTEAERPAPDFPEADLAYHPQADGADAGSSEADHMEQRPANPSFDTALPLPAAEPIREFREPEAEAPRGRVNGNGIMRSVPEAEDGMDDGASVSQHEDEPQATDDAEAEAPGIASPPKPRGTKRGWWQRRVEE